MAGKQQIISDRNRVRVRGIKPPLSKGKTSYLLYRNQGLFLGDHPVSWTVALGRHFIGFHVPLWTNPDSRDERTGEVFELLSLLVERGYDYVPPGVLTELKDPVSTSLIRGSDVWYLGCDKYDIAMPLRRACEGCRSYYYWDSSSLDCKLCQFRNIKHLNIPGRNILLIAYNPRCTCDKDITEEEIQHEDLEDIFS
jgi:hypothetical protein